MILNIKPLLDEQAKLDAHIQQQHHVNYQSTREKRILALLVEVGEMINETKTFKFWSTKPSAAKPIILDEYADGLHFLLSLSIEIQSQKMDYEIEPFKGSLTEATIAVFQAIVDLSRSFTIQHVETAFQLYLNLSPLLEVQTTEIVDAYFKKLGVNYNRQQNAY